jgi:hypothetical protein
MPEASQISPVHVRQQLQALHLEGLRTLCADLNIEYEDIRGETLEAKARELVQFMQRRNRLAELTAYLERPAPAGNPFGDRGQIGPERFFDRTELLRQIFEELSKGQSVSLVGEREVGKSSLLAMICAQGRQRIQPPPDAIVYLSLQVAHDEGDFFEALCDALEVPNCRGSKLDRALRGRRCVLCLDEAEVINSAGFTLNTRRELRGLAAGAALPLKLVIASRNPLSKLFPDSPELDSPLAGICLPLEVGPFSLDTIRAFVAHRLRGTGVTFTEGEVAALAAETGGHPARVQRAAADLYNVKRMA